MAIAGELARPVDPPRTEGRHPEAAAGRYAAALGLANCRITGLAAWYEALRGFYAKGGGAAEQAQPAGCGTEENAR